MNLHGTPPPPETGGDPSTPSPWPPGRRTPWRRSLTLADLYWTELAQNRDLARPVLTFQDLVEARQAGQIGACSPWRGGVCQASLCRTPLSPGGGILTPSPGTTPTSWAPLTARPGGLTETGFAFLAEMEALGMPPRRLPPLRRGLLGRVPGRPAAFLASHSNARALWPHRRNLTDEMLRALGTGGLVGGPTTPASWAPGATSQPADLLRHLRHMIHVAGLETVALGSDFDGIDTPLAWGDAGGMDQVVQALDQGASPREIDAICWENAWKFFQRTL